MHFFRNLKNKFKEPISKHDIKRFLMEGFLGAVIFGSFMGMAQFFILTTNLSFLSLLTFLIFYVFLTRRLYRSFSFYHIWYSILAVFFVLLGDYFINVTGHLLFFFIKTKQIVWEVFNPLIYYNFLYYWPKDIFTILYNLLSIILYVVICVTTYIQMKR
ncbi:MAG: hypothetical protein GX931_06095 [Acholeplasmataceae bacterium]|jgi:hypothetical protein|nr:hypothetical protein [Acholeplasmataceae bacterium]